MGVSRWQGPWRSLGAANVSLREAVRWLDFATRASKQRERIDCLRLRGHEGVARADIWSVCGCPCVGGVVSNGEAWPLLSI